MQLSDLDSVEEDHGSDKDLDDLLNEDNPHFKKSESKVSKEEKLKKSVIENKRSLKYLDNPQEDQTKSIPLKSSMTLSNSILRASTVSRKNTNNIKANAGVPFLSKNAKNANESELTNEFYDEKVESKFILKFYLNSANLEYYHAVDKMKSLGVLQNEMDLMDHIIEFSKKSNLDSDTFDNKKFFIKNQMDVRISHY